MKVVSRLHWTGVHCSGCSWVTGTSQWLRVAGEGEVCLTGIIIAWGCLPLARALHGASSAAGAGRDSASSATRRAGHSADVAHLHCDS